MFDTVCAQYLVFDVTLDSHQLIPKCLPIQEIIILYRYIPTCIYLFLLRASHRASVKPAPKIENINELSSPRPFFKPTMQ